MSRVQDHLLLRTLMRGVARPAPQFKARYNAANSSSYARGAPARARHLYWDVTPRERRFLQDSSADLYDNEPIFHGVIERMITYVIGSGIWPESASKDKGYNAAADEAFMACAVDCEFRGGLTWATMQEQTYRNQLRDGDCGHILTTHDSRDNGGLPCCHVNEGRQIGDPLFQDLGYYDGVKVDDKGRAVSYRITEENEKLERTIVDVKSKDFVLFLDPLRPGQRRGFPLLASALETARDLHETLSLEKLAVKDASSKTDIISTESGEADPEDLVRTGGTTINGSDGADGVKYYREIFGPEAKYIRNGDTWQAYQSDRPGPAWQGFVKFLSESICLAARIPPSCVLQMSVGGADARRDLAVMTRVIEMIQHRLAGQFLRVRNHFVEGVLGTRGLPKDWQAVAWQFPKSPTVDAGREAQQDREDIRARRMTEQEYQGRYGLNYKKVRDQVEAEVMDNIDRAKRIAAYGGIQVGEALQLMGELPPPGQQPTGLNPAAPTTAPTNQEVAP